MDARGKQIVKTVACGAWWTRTRLQDAGYIVDDVRCEKCRDINGGEPDTLFHRVWCCPWQEAVKARNDAACKQLRDAALKAGQQSALYSRCIMPHAADLLPLPPAEGGCVFKRQGQIVQASEDWSMKGRIFYDGSCTRRGDQRLDRASWAVVEVNDKDEITAEISGPVWSSLPQTPQAAEYAARAVAVEMLDGDSVLTGDCKNVVNDAVNNDKKKVYHKRRMHAGTMRQADNDCRAKHVIADR